MIKTCQACGGTVCEVCGGCIAHGECSCIEDRIQEYIDRAEVAEARLQLTVENAAKLRQLADKLFDAVYGLYTSSGEEDWSEIEPAMKAYGRATGKY